MDCSKIRRLLSAYLDCELPAERRGAVRRHLHNCEACQELLEGFKNLAVLTANWTDMLAPASLWDRLAPKLKAGCAAAKAESPVGLTAPNRQSRPTRGFKPVLEGLEDRFPPTDLLGAAAVAWSPPVMTAAITLFHAATGPEVAPVCGYGDFVLA